MTCNTCGAVYGQIAKDTSESRPTWVCVNGHRQAWGERPAWIESAAMELCVAFGARLPASHCDRIAEVIEREWRKEAT